MSLARVVLAAPAGAFGLRVALPLSDLRGCLLPLLAALEPASGKVAIVKFSLILKAARRFARKIVLLPIQIISICWVLPRVLGSIAISPLNAESQSGSARMFMANGAFGSRISMR